MHDPKFSDVQFETPSLASLERGRDDLADKYVTAYTTALAPLLALGQPATLTLEIQLPPNLTADQLTCSKAYLLFVRAAQNKGAHLRTERLPDALRVIFTWT